MRDHNGLYYWECFYDADSAMRALGGGCMLFDSAKEQGDNAAMKQSYPSYVKRRWKIFQNGNCLGYTTDEVVDNLRLNGVIA